MAKLTCTKHGDQATHLVLYWREQTEREVKAPSWFMAALALGSALEAVMYAYFIVWTGDEENDPAKDGKVPDDIALFDLIEPAKEFDLLSSVNFNGKFGEHAVEDVILEISHMRNNVHAGVALRKNFDPAKFTKRQYMRLQDIFDAVLDNYNRNL
jgi:hypothetical protein